jgi:transcriptional regulator with XRE-family HTH domain
MNLDREREDFSRRLREQREARELSVADVARITKIPERSLAHLESGSFEKLPAEVFVRGFLKSYCRAVGADADETLRSYGLLVHDQPRTPPTLTKPAASGALRLAEGSTSPVDEVVKAEPPPEPEPEVHGILGAIHGAGRSTRRMSLTLAVIILVIVATLTLSFLLRRPSHVGDGLSIAPGVSDPAG